MSPDSLNDYFLHPNLSSINSNLPSTLKCFVSSPSSIIFTAFSITNIFLIVPLSIPIIYHGIQQKRTNSPSATCHSDIFTYHMTILTLIGVLGCILCCFGISLWWSFLSIPYLCGTLLGCCSSHHLPQPEKWKRDHDQKYQHWLRLDAVSCIHCFNDGSRTGHYFEFFYWVFICNHHQLLQLFCYVYFDPSRPRGTGCT